ncbi:MAG: hypothetical protein ACC660_08475 [Acidimicrobiales bacterium]
MRVKGERIASNNTPGFESVEPWVVMSIYEGSLDERVFRVVTVKSFSLKLGPGLVRWSRSELSAVPLDEVRDGHDGIGCRYRQQHRCSDTRLWQANRPNRCRWRWWGYRDDRAALFVCCPVMLIRGCEERRQAPRLNRGVGAAESCLALLGVITPPHLSPDSHSRVGGDVAVGVI